jgi:hypothetical protein
MSGGITSIEAPIFPEFPDFGLWNGMTIPGKVPIRKGVGHENGEVTWHLEHQSKLSW